MVKKSSSNRRHRTKKINDACKVKKNDTVNKKRWTAQSKNEFFKQKRKKNEIKNKSSSKITRREKKSVKMLKRENIWLKTTEKTKKKKWRKKRRTKPKTKFIFVVCRRRRIHFTKGIKCLKSKRGDYFLQSLLYNLRTLCANRSIGKPLRKK